MFSDANKRMIDLCRAAYLMMAGLMLIRPEAEAASAIAFTPNAENYTVSTGHPNKNAAEKASLKGCNEGMRARNEMGKCKVTLSRDGAGYIAVVYGSDGVGVGHSTAGAQAAVDVAYERCTARYKNCQDSNISYYIDEPKPVRSVASNPQDCRPRTEVLRCSSSCTNGDCIVRYENGCAMQVRVAPVFNGFKNAWEYPSPRC